MDMDYCFPFAVSFSRLEKVTTMGVNRPVLNLDKKFGALLCCKVEFTS
jgi:hypothetical protein